MSKKKVFNFLKYLLPILLGSFLIWYSLGKMTGQERQQLWEAMKSANPLWVSASLVFALLSHISRSYRWKFMLEPLGCHPKLKHSFIAVMTAYFANTFVLRIGEVLRGVVISKLEPISFDKAFGTIVSERLADLVMLILIMATAVFLQSTALIDFFKESANPLPSIIALTLMLFIGIIGLRILKNSKHPLMVKVRNFGLGILEGVKSILKMKNNTAFIFHTIFIWTMYASMFWIMKYTVPSLGDAPLGVMLTAFIAGGFSMSATNAGMGLYPIAMVAVFANLFGYASQDAQAFGWIVWTTQTVFNIVFGGFCCLIFLFKLKKIKN